MSRKGIFLVLVSAIVYGLTPATERMIFSDGGNVINMLQYRPLMMCLVLGAFYFRRTKLPDRAKPVSVKYLAKLALCSVLFLATTGLLVSSYSHIPSGLSTTLHFSYPLLTLLICRVAFSEKVTLAGAICCFLCLVGLICIGGGNDSVNLIGAALAFSSGLTYSLYVIWLSKSRIYESGNYFRIAFFIALMNALIMIPISIGSGELIPKLPLRGWLLLALIGCVFDVTAMVCFQVGVNLIGPQMASFLSVAEPVVSIAAGAALYRDGLPLLTMIGIILVLASVVVLSTRNLVSPGAGLPQALSEAREMSDNKNAPRTGEPQTGVEIQARGDPLISGGLQPGGETQTDGEAVSGHPHPCGADVQNKESPKLPADFFSKLVHQPKCLTGGECDNCGRCEH